MLNLVRYWEITIGIFISIHLSGCASPKPKLVVIQVENNPKYVPFQRIGYDVTADIGSKLFRGVPQAHHSKMDEYTQYLVDFSEIKKYRDIVTEIDLVEGNTRKSIKDNVDFKDSCEFIYNVTKSNSLPSKNSILIYGNDSLKIYKTEDNNCYW